MIERILRRLELLTAGLCLVLLLGLSLLQIIARNFFETGFSVADPISRHLVLYIIFMGAVLATQSGRHIKLDLFLQWMNSRQKFVIQKGLSLFSALVCALFSWASAVFWLDELQYVSDHERWLTHIAVIIPIGFILLCVHFLFRLFTNPTGTRTSP